LHYQLVVQDFPSLWREFTIEERGQFTRSLYESESGRAQPVDTVNTSTELMELM
jgi:hypothetical protein